MLYIILKRKVYELLEVLLVPVFDVHYGVQHVPEVLESVFNIFLLNNQAEMLYIIVKRKVYKLLEVLLVPVFDVHYGVQHVPVVLESVFNIFLLNNQAEMMYNQPNERFMSYLMYSGICSIVVFTLWRTLRKSTGGIEFTQQSITFSFAITYSILFYSKTRQK